MRALAVTVLVATHAAASIAGGAADYEVARAATAISVDGSAADAAWRRAASIDDFAASWLGPAGRELGRSSARLLWDDEYLYFVAELEDADVLASSRRDDDPLWLGDVFELFFKPAADQPSYYELQVNPANARLDMYLPHRAADAYRRWARSRPFAWQTAVQKTSSGWTVEGRIPWSDFAPSGGRPVPSQTWRFALCRYDHAPDREPILTSSAPLTRPDFHRWEEWQTLRFAPESE